MRSGAGVPVSMVLAGNPGGPGQQWIKQRYVDPWPAGGRVLEIKLPNEAIHRRIFIRSFVRDNKVLLQKDPEYINRLYMVGHPTLVKAWLDGDWSAVESAFFPEWNL